MKSITIAMFMLLATGCNTMEALDITGESLADGDIGTASLGVILVPAGMLMDVVTLGGLLSPDDGQTVWQSAADSQSSANARELERRKTEIDAKYGTNKTTSTDKYTPCRTYVSGQCGPKYGVPCCGDQ